MSGAKKHAGIRIGLRQKVLLILLTTLLVTLTVNSWFALRAQQTEVLNETTRRGQEMARFLAQYLAYSVIAYDYHTMELLLKELSGNPGVVYAKVVSAKGNTMAEIGARGGDSSNRVAFREDVRLNNELVGRLFLDLSTEHIVSGLQKQRLASIERQFMVMFAILLVELVALSYFIVRPIGVITRVIRESVDAEGRVVRPIPLDSDDELGEVARQFNRLQAQLADAQGRLQAKVDLANDELRLANQQLTAQAAELQRANRELERLTVTDALTGLYNRRYVFTLMDNEVSLSVRNNETNSILLADIDRFKSYNDEHGHDVGDEIIKAVAKLISERIRKTDVACRYGGDEFFILCRRATPVSVLMIADDLRRAMAETPIRIGALELNITLSIGAATIPSAQPVTTAEELFRCADIALYRSKQQGRDSVAHYSMLNEGQRAHRA
jgi:diguanylate cyclase (GGDEF)-like protein